MAAEGSATFLQPEFLKRLERLRLVAKRLAASGLKGEHASSRKGFSLEFSDYRKYQMGDDLRYVDWNIYRRLERLFLKAFTAEEEMNVYLLLDASRSMAEGSPPKIEYAKTVAAALGYVGLKNLDRVGGGAFSSDLRSSLALGRGKRQILSLFDFLGKLSCEGDTDLDVSVKSFSNLFPRPGLVVLLSDLLDPHGWRAGLEEFLRRKNQLLIVHILDESESRVEARGDVSLFDVEGAGERKIFLDEGLVRAFQGEFGRYLEEIASFCLRREVDYLRTNTGTPFEDFVLLALRRVRSVS
jgi:uncharacterized protein (DUF58 family)